MEARVVSSRNESSGILYKRQNCVRESLDESCWPTVNVRKCRCSSEENNAEDNAPLQGYLLSSTHRDGGTKREIISDGFWSK